MDRLNYPKTIFYISINLCFTLLIFLMFLLELRGLINPVKHPEGYVVQTIPFLSTIGVISWFGLVRRRAWGLFVFQGYIIFTIIYQALDLVENFGRATLVQVLLTLPISILLYIYFKKNSGMVWHRKIWEGRGSRNNQWGYLMRGFIVILTNIFFRRRSLYILYRQGIETMQLSLYQVIVSVLQDELGRDYTGKELKEAAAITVNLLGLRNEERADPSLLDNDLGLALREIKELTLIKESASLILMFDYLLGDKRDKDRYEAARKLAGPDFETTYNMIDSSKASPNKVLSLISTMSNKLLEISLSNIESKISS